jgi:hypothetical protein
VDNTKPDDVSIPDGVLSDTEATAILERIFSGYRPDSQLGIWIEQLKRTTGCPHIQNLIKYRRESETPADILRRAREYRPIQL